MYIDQCVQAGSEVSFVRVLWEIERSGAGKHRQRSCCRVFQSRGTLEERVQAGGKTSSLLTTCFGIERREGKRRGEALLT